MSNPFVDLYDEPEDDTPAEELGEQHVTVRHGVTVRIVERDIGVKICNKCGCEHDAIMEYSLNRTTARDIYAPVITINIKRRAYCIHCEHKKKALSESDRKMKPRPTKPFSCPGCHNMIDPNKAVLDHDHKTGNAREWICGNCNTSMGKAGDDPDKLKNLANYILGHDNAHKEKDIFQDFVE